MEAIAQEKPCLTKGCRKCKSNYHYYHHGFAFTGVYFHFQFPGLDSRPRHATDQCIEGGVEKDYSQRIYLDRNDEFGKMAEAFNTMAKRLDYYENSNLAKIMFEKQRAETVINSFKDASIGIDNKGIILFANTQALQLLNLKNPTWWADHRTI